MMFQNETVRIESLRNETVRIEFDRRAIDYRLLGARTFFQGRTCTTPLIDSIDVPGLHSFARQGIVCDAELTLANAGRC